MQVAGLDGDAAARFRLRRFDGMAIPFVPERGRILMCDYNMANVPPEMRKRRRAVVVSPRSYNRRHGSKPGRCIVVPFSATYPKRFLTAADVPFDSVTYKALTRNTWAICSAIMSVSHDRLDRVPVRQHVRPYMYFSNEILSSADMLRIEEGLQHALGTAQVP